MVRTVLCAAWQSNGRSFRTENCAGHFVSAHHSGDAPCRTSILANKPDKISVPNCFSVSLSTNSKTRRLSLRQGGLNAECFCDF